MEMQPVHELKYLFLEEKRINDRKGVYARTQKMMAYNSNKIEGSTLTSEQTALLFDTGTLRGTDGEIYRAKDIEEMSGHFAMFHYMLDTLEQPLSEQIIKDFHKYLKAGVFEDFANGYPVGEYKNRYNIVSDIETVVPGDVHGKMKELLDGYQGYGNLEGILMFHAKFEKIHPFQDGNGRVGRMILFRECLANDMIPVIVKDEYKADYYHVLHEAQVYERYEELFAFGIRCQELYKKEISPFLECTIRRHNPITPRTIKL